MEEATESTPLAGKGESCDDPRVEHWRACSEGGDLKVNVEGASGSTSMWGTSRMNIIEHPLLPAVLLEHSFFSSDFPANTSGFQLGQHHFPCPFFLRGGHPQCWEEAQSFCGGGESG